MADRLSTPSTLGWTAPLSTRSRPPQHNGNTALCPRLDDREFGEVILGWQSFSNVDTDVWIDDIVLSNSPIGCN